MSPKFSSKLNWTNESAKVSSLAIISILIYTYDRTVWFDLSYIAPARMTFYALFQGGLQISDVLHKVYC